jgi:hypothetical protein
MKDDYCRTYNLRISTPAAYKQLNILMFNMLGVGLVAALYFDVKVSGVWCCLRWSPQQIEFFAEVLKA